jgi:alkylation response protein AidB-like acyl-CoA dehydrogenase
MSEPILQAIERFLEREVRPHVRELEAKDIWPAEIVQKMTAMGLFGCVIEERYGGLGLPAGTYAKLIERLSEVWMSLAGIINSHLIMATLVQRAGTQEQRRAWLPRFAAGELRGGLALTEPDCGTDLRAIRTRARREGDVYVINGTKTWISNGIHGHVVALLAKTEGEALSCFICE